MCPNCRKWWLRCCVYYNLSELTPDPAIVSCHPGVAFCVNKKVRAAHNDCLVEMTTESISDKLVRAGHFWKNLKVVFMFISGSIYQQMFG